MTTIVLSSPKPDRQPKWQVVGAYKGDVDRFVFGCRRFEPDEQQRAEEYARWMMDEHGADHFERR